MLVFLVSFDIVIDSIFANRTRLSQLIERLRLKHPWLQQHEFRDHIFLDSVFLCAYCVRTCLSLISFIAPDN